MNEKQLDKADTVRTTLEELIRYLTRPGFCGVGKLVIDGHNGRVTGVKLLLEQRK